MPQTMFYLRDFQRKSENTVTEVKNLDFLHCLTSKWNNVHEKTDVFRYKVDKLQEKVVGGYFLQLNPNRSTKRRTPELIDNICQPFDKDKFNFTKVSSNEVLFSLKKDAEDTNNHTILVNVSPVNKYHSLLCPFIDKCLPQVITEESLVLAIEIMFCVGDRTFRIGFNSLCGLASVNHLHYHFFIEKSVLPVECASCQHLQGPVYILKDYPISAFCFEVTVQHSPKEKAKEIFKLMSHLLDCGIAHNVFITMGSSVSGKTNEVIRVLIWPRRSTAGVKTYTAFNVAVLELSGWFPIYNDDDFAKLERDDLEKVLNEWKIDNFDILCKEIKDLY